jgi:MFS family permease
MGLLAINAANLLAIFGALLIVGLNVMGMSADKFGGKSALIVSFALMTVAFLLIILSEEIWMLYLFAGVVGFASGGLQVLFSPVIAELFGLRSHGVLFASAVFLGGIGAAVSPAIAGYIFDVTGSYSLAFIICAIMAAIAFMMALFLRPLRSEGGSNQ